LFVAIAVVFFTEMDSINRIPAFIPEPNFIIYASIMATLVSGFVVIDVMWFWGP